MTTRAVPKGCDNGRKKLKLDKPQVGKSKQILFFDFSVTDFFVFVLQARKEGRRNETAFFANTLYMGKKKKGKKKKKGGGGGDTGGGTAELIAYDSTDTRRYIHVSMHMENWTFADRLWPKGGFWLETKTRLFIIHKMIKQRHGAVQNVRIWKVRKTQENLLLGEMKTLNEFGFQGEIRPQDRPRLGTGDNGSPPGTAASTASGDGGDGGDGGEGGEGGDDGGEKGEVAFEDGMVAGDATRGSDEDVGGGTRPTTGATEATEDNETAPEDDYEHIRLIYDFTPANLDDPLLLISPRV